MSVNYLVALLHMFYAHLATIIGYVIAFSGWGKVLYDHVSSKPKIRGRVLNMMRALWPNPVQNGETLAAFIAYLYLVNKRRNLIHILDYMLEARVGSKWIKLRRVYGIHKVKNSFDGVFGKNIQVNNFEDNLIYRKNKPVEYGIPLHGWIVFAGPKYLYSSEIPAFRLTCIDAFRKKHVIVSRQEEFENLPLLQDIADFKISDEDI